MKTILHLIDSLSVGGAEKLLAGVINELKGFNQHLIILEGPETLKDSISANCKFTNLNASGGWTGYWPAARKVKAYIRDNKISIVHSHLYRSNIIARLATPPDVKLFNSIHAISSLASYKVNRLTLYLEKFSYRKRHRIISVSREVEKDFDQWIGIKGPSAILYNYIDDKFFANLPKKDFSAEGLRLVAVGNLRYQKNYPFLLEAFKQLPPAVTLDIYGEGSMRKELQRTIDEHNLPVRLCGLRDDLHRILPSYDLFVMSSYYEGQPLSLLEAVATGLPAMLSDIPVLREVLEQDALYFDINDSSSFVKKIQEVINNRQVLPILAASAGKRVNAFARKSNYLEKLVGLYNSL